MINDFNLENITETLNLKEELNEFDPWLRVTGVLKVMFVRFDSPSSLTAKDTVTDFPCSTFETLLVTLTKVIAALEKFSSNIKNKIPAKKVYNDFDFIL